MRAVSGFTSLSRTRENTGYIVYSVEYLEKERKYNYSGYVSAVSGFTSLSRTRENTGYIVYSVEYLEKERNTIQDT